MLQILLYCWFIRHCCVNTKKNLKAVELCTQNNEQITENYSPVATFLPFTNGIKNVCSNDFAIVETAITAPHSTAQSLRLLFFQPSHSERQSTIICKRALTASCAIVCLSCWNLEAMSQNAHNYKIDKFAKAPLNVAKAFSGAAEKNDLKSKQNISCFASQQHAFWLFPCWCLLHIQSESVFVIWQIFSNCTQTF